MALAHSDWLHYIHNLLYRGVGALPDVNKYRLCLSSSGLLTRSMQKAAILVTELPLANGYGRKIVNYISDSVFYNTESRDRFDPITIDWTATGGSLQFSSLFLLANASSIANAQCTVSGGKVVLTGHGLMAGDEVCFSPVSGSFPPEMNTSTLYKVVNPTIGDFQIATIAAPTVPIALSSATGTYRLHYANGTIVEIHVEDSPRLRQDGQSYSVEINRAIAAMTYGNGI
jgi:hypothetical protein